MRGQGGYLIIERLTIVKDTIENGYYPSLALLRKRVLDRLGTDVSIPTLRRDLNFLRCRFGIDIKYDSYRQGYYIEPVDTN